ncbi:MotA/TolQ/ExbB proton channel family protein [Chondromyces apiculatus]|uniref:MotA/TolQ/ExbB proton channel family protein n=1 Tax=Chondromyces apiculatus DSM 436 TaxID=1192034 RepID=A0A017TF68_9BACT|nr:MotA/TolQ/ExbB proton channel family protein [Chondromyces apiculatus]EYF07938.1 MotA/TolQ/ExbB proton channel family protein [Chondromyces apiculatus DSM 436]
MNLVEWLQRIMVGFGAAWVMWLMIGLSVISVAIILERAWFFWSLRDDLSVLARDLRTSLDDSIEAARKRMEASPSAEAAVVSAGLAVAHKGPEAAEEAMGGATALQRMKLERRLAYLGTLGNNAPFIGLFGTVIGVVMAFEALGKDAVTTAGAQATQVAQTAAPQAVMSSIAEALVATAVGLAVAIPAVAFNNFFQRMIKATLANTEALTRILLSHLKSDLAFEVPGEGVAPPPVVEKPRKAGKIAEARATASTTVSTTAKKNANDAPPASASEEES